MYRDLREAKRIILEENNLPHAPIQDHGINLKSTKPARVSKHLHPLKDTYASALNDNTAASYFIIAALLRIKDPRSHIATA